METFHYAALFGIFHYPDTPAYGHLGRDPLEQLNGNGVFFVIQLGNVLISMTVLALKCIFKKTTVYFQYDLFDKKLIL